MNKRYIIIFTLFFAISLLVLGCVKKPVSNMPAGDQGNGQEQNAQAQNSNNEVQNNATNTEAEVITSDIDTSDWQTYRNEELGFEFMYPKSWNHLIRNSGFIELKDDARKVYYENSETYLIGISVTKFDRVIDSNEFVESWRKSKLQDGWIKRININGVDVIQGRNFFGLDTIIISTENNIVVKIIKGQFSPLYESLDNLYIGLISTWKFI